LAYSLATIVQFAVVGVGVPPHAAGIFALLHDHKIEALLRLDLPTVFAMPLYYLLFLGLFAALWRVDLSKSILSTALAFAGTTLVIATPTGLPMLRLSEMYAAASSDALKDQYLAAGEAIMATDIWHHTGAIVGGVLVQTGAVLICWVMLRGGVFNKGTAWLGIVMHSLDLAHIVCGVVAPPVGVVLMSIAGPLYPIWLFLVGWRLLKLASRKAGQPMGQPVPAN
jgi:hypothetical protein